MVARLRSLCELRRGIRPARVDTTGASDAVSPKRVREWAARRRMAPRAGFEPATLRLTGERGRSDRVRRSAAKCLISQPLDSLSSINIAIHRSRHKPAVSAGSCHSPRHSVTSRANGFSWLRSARLAEAAAIEVNIRSGVERPRGTARSSRGAGAPAIEVKVRSGVERPRGTARSQLR